MGRSVAPVASSTFDVADAVRRARKGDIAGAALSGAGGVGSLGVEGLLLLGVIQPEIGIPLAIGAGLGPQMINLYRDINKSKETDQSNPKKKP